MRLRERLPDIGLEIFSVVLAVLLALFVNEWRKERADSALAERALAAVIEEVRANRVELASTVADHEESLDSLQVVIAAIDAGSESRGRSVDYDICLLRETAWETARMTQVVIHMDYETVAEVSEAYDLQGLYLRMTDDFIDDMLRQRRPGSVEEARAMYMHHTGYLTNLVDVGHSLLDSYDGLLSSE